LKTTGAKPKILSAAVVFAILAWLVLLLGLLYAKFYVTEPPPSPVMTFSDKGLTRLFAELLGFALGCLGFLLSAIAFALNARNRALAYAVIGNAAVCAVCFALLI
jgi:hypothetical protein